MLQIHHHESFDVCTERRSSFMILLLSSCHYEPLSRAATSATQSDHRGPKVSKLLYHVGPGRAR